jgi:hypothetical protein
MGEDIISIIFLAFIAIVISGIVSNVNLPHMGVPTFILIAVGLWISYDYILLKRYQAKKQCKSSKKENLTDLENRVSAGINNSFEYQNLSGDSIVKEELYTMGDGPLDIKPLDSDLENIKSPKSMLDDIDEVTKQELKNTKYDIGKKILADSPSLADYNNNLYVPLDSDEKPDNLYDVTKSLEYSEPKHKNEFDINYYKTDITIQDIHKDMGSTLDNKLSNRMKYMGLQNKISKDTRSRFNRYTIQPYFEEELKENENRDWWNVEQDYLDNYM